MKSSLWRLTYQLWLNINHRYSCMVQANYAVVVTSSNIREEFCWHWKVIYSRIYFVSTRITGIPCFVWAVRELNSPTETKNFLLAKYEENQSRAVPVIYAHCLNLSIRVAWLMVSNAAQRSSNSKTEHVPESAAISKSFVTQGGKFLCYVACGKQVLTPPKYCCY